MKALITTILVLVGLTAGAGAGNVLVARVDGIIGPVSAKFMVDAMERAERESAECLIFELDTPGGLDDSMRVIIKKIMASKVPIVVYVAPAGSRAASAGAFITLSAHVAAMAPGTTIGAAHPVSLGQSFQTDSNMAEKVINDSAAYIRSIAEKRGRNIEWAQSAVRESVSLSETEALQQRVIDLIAPDTPALLDLLDGRAVSVGTGSVTLKTKGAQTMPIEMDWRERLLAAIANPNIAYVLFMVGLLGLYFELSTPGAILPGVAGVICLILAFFAFHTLPVSYAGIALIVLSIVLFIVDVKAAAHGALTIGGLVAMFMGSIMLFDTPDPALRVSLQVIVPMVLTTGAFFAIGILLSAVALHRKPVSGAEGLVGQEGDARTAIDKKDGKVFVAGAHWNAVAEAAIAPGAPVRVVGVKGLTLKVEEIK